MTVKDVFDLRKQGKIEEAYEAIRPYVGRSSEDLWTAMKAKYDIPASVEDLIELQWKKNVAGLAQSGLERSEGLTELLDFCHAKGIRVAVASSSRQDFVEAVFDHLNLWPYVEVFVSGTEVEHGKPMPDIFLLAATRLDIDPERCLVIEDSTSGVQAGRMAGMYTIGYDNPTSGGQNVTAADVVIKSLKEVPKIIEQLSSVQLLPVNSPTRKMASSLRKGAIMAASPSIERTLLRGGPSCSLEPTLAKPLLRMVKSVVITKTDCLH